MLAILGAVVAALTFAAARMPYFPTDLAIARAIQALAPLPTSVATWITATADQPGCYVLLAITIALAWAIAGWRAGAIAIVLFFALWFAGIRLSPIVAQPRPSPGLIRVVGHPKGYAFPSIFGLIYMATFGYVGILAMLRSSGVMRATITAIAAAALTIGAIARIDLGAHWPSDLWVAYLMGTLAILILIPPIPRNSEHKD